jgi:Protein of unknown function (DUF3606)
MATQSSGRTWVPTQIGSLIRTFETHARSPIWKESAMADDKTNRGPQDRSRVSLSEDYEVRYWTKELGVSKDELARLVQQHGNSVEKLRQALGK